jgi:hypothetical protein
MSDSKPDAKAPAEWLEVLADSEADIAAGRIVDGEVVMRELYDAIARFETDGAARRKRGPAAGR